MLASFAVSGMTADSLKDARKRSYSKTVSIVDEHSPRLNPTAETGSAKDYSENLTELICGIQEHNIHKVNASLKWWISDADLDEALDTLIRSSDKYDEQTKSIMEELLKKGANPNNQRGRIYCTLAIEAIRYRDLDLMKLLLKYGLNPNAKDKRGRTLRQIAEDQNDNSLNILSTTSTHNRAAVYKILVDHNQKDLDMIDLLFQSGAHNNVGDTLLTDAVKNSGKFDLQHLLENKANINAPAANGWTPLMHAVFEGKIDIVKYLIEKGANINLKNEDGKNALMIATENHWNDIVRYLLDNGADVYARNKNCETAFGIALSHGYKGIAIMLLNAMYNKVSLIDEVIYGQESVVDWLLQQNEIDVNIKGRGGITPLMIAAETGDLGIAKYLLAAEADINVKNDDGETALSIALSKGNNNVVNLLLSVGAEVSEQDKFSLIDAAKNGYFNIVKYCVEHGFYIDEKGIDNITPLMLASANGHKNIVKYLLAKGADCFLKEDSRKYNALMFAVENGQQDVIKIMLNHVKLAAKIKNLNGFNQNLLSRIAASSYVNAQDKFGNNSLMIAVTQGHIHQNHRKIINLLMKSGADVYCENKFRKTPISIAKECHVKAKSQGKVKWSEIIKILTK